MRSRTSDRTIGTPISITGTFCDCGATASYSVARVDQQLMSTATYRVIRQDSGGFAVGITTRDGAKTVVPDFWTEPEAAAWAALQQCPPKQPNSG